MRLIDADALKTPIEDRIDNIPASEYDNGWNNAIYAVIDEIDNAPTVFKALILDDMSEDKMIEFTRAWQKFQSQGTTIVNERLQGETNAEIFKQIFGIYATEVWSMSEADFLKWLNQQVPQFEVDEIPTFNRKELVKAEERPHGDLISREALKNYARKVMYEKNATNFSLLKVFDEIIDNAPIQRGEEE